MREEGRVTKIRLAAGTNVVFFRDFAGKDAKDLLGTLLYISFINQERALNNQQFHGQHIQKKEKAYHDTHVIVCNKRKDSPERRLFCADILGVGSA